MITIRLKPMGTKNQKKWRIVVNDPRLSPSGRFIEEIGYYDPTVNPPKVRIQQDRYEDWVRKGAQPSRTVRTLAKGKKIE